MSAVDQIIQMVGELRAMSIWSKQRIEALLGVTLGRDPKARETHKRHIARKDGWLTRAEFLHPTYGAVGDMHVRIEVDWEEHVRQEDLGLLIPKHPVTKFNPPPTPGSKGPARFSFYVEAPDKRGPATFSFERRDGSPPYLHGVHVAHKSPAHDVSDSAPGHFRAYAVSPDEPASYVIERVPGHTAAVDISALQLTGRTLSLSFRVVEDWLSEPQARTLIRELVVLGVLKRELDGKLDAIVFNALDLNSAVTESLVLKPKADRR